MNSHSSAQDRIAETWQSMTIAERETLLNGLQAVIQSETVWNELPVEVIALNPDYDSLPFDLGGHLLWAYGENGLSVENFKKWAGFFCG